MDCEVRLAVINDQLHFGAHGRRECQSAGLTFTHVKRRLGQVVLKEFHLDKTIVRDDREGVFKRGLQAFNRAFLGRALSLQKRRVGVFLHLQQIRNGYHAFAIAEAFADAFAFGEAVTCS